MLYRFDKVQGLDPYYYSFNPCHPFSQGDCVDTAVSSRFTLISNALLSQFASPRGGLHLTTCFCICCFLPVTFFVYVLFPVVVFFLSVAAMASKVRGTVIFWRAPVASAL